MPQEAEIGAIFGRLTVVEDLGTIKKKRRFKCQCSCGGWKTTDKYSLQDGRTMSCGCLNKEKPSSTKHGGYYTPEYRIWAEMLQRCSNQKNPQYHNYGGRGITVCERWLKFENFFEDMGPRPEGLSLDRKDNDQGYSKDNCRWATRKEQNRNKNNTVKVVWQGKEVPLRDLADQFNIPRARLYQRVVTMKWPLEKALTTPHGGMS